MANQIIKTKISNQSETWFYANWLNLTSLSMRMTRTRCQWKSPRKTICFNENYNVALNQAQLSFQLFPSPAFRFREIRSLLFFLSLSIQQINSVPSFRYFLSFVGIIFKVLFFPFSSFQSKAIKKKNVAKDE